MNTTVKKNAFLKRIAKTPLLKLLSRTMNVIRNNDLRKKKPIIRQGAPECFEENSPLKVEWSLTSYCNYRCSYCFRAGKGYEKIFCSLEQAETAIKHIASANRPSYQVSLHGGEPTSHPQLANIITLFCKYLGDRLESLLILTNGSFNEDQLETILKLMEQYSIKVFVSIHLEFMSIDRAVYLVERLSRHGVLIMTVMLKPDLFEKAKAMTDTLCELRKRYPFDLDIKYLKTPPHFDSFDPRYTQEHFDWVDAMKERIGRISAEGPQRDKEYPKVSGWEYVVERKSHGTSETLYCKSSDELKKMTGLNFSGMTCCAGTNVLSIYTNGDVRGLQCNAAKIMCNIFEENPFQLDDWMQGVVCTKPMCGNPTNHRVPKFKSPAAAEKHIARVKEAQKNSR